MSRTLDAALLALHIELLEWPGFVLSEMGRGTMWSSREPEETILPDNWHVIAILREGHKGREHYQGNGKTLIAAVDGLTAELVSRRTDPHQWHVSDWMQEGRFVNGCPDCEREAHEIFEDEVDWVPA